MDPERSEMVPDFRIGADGPRDEKRGGSKDGPVARVSGEARDGGSERQRQWQTYWCQQMSGMLCLRRPYALLCLVWKEPQ